MQFPESWLREFSNPNLSTAQLADTLTMAGLEVEELKPVAPPFSKIVIGEIVEAMQHPNADRLRVCKVDVGTHSLLDIVCGAPNARVGIKVPVALVGAELPPGEDGKPFLIKVGKLRGVESQGMLCSSRELKLSDDHGGLMELASDAVLGQDIRTYLNLDDTLFTLKLTPNLAHCLSVYGVAREVSALTGVHLNKPLFPTIPVTTPEILPVKVSALNLCGRFSGRILRNVNPKAPTPQWMIDRLSRCGQRSVTSLVDISNYVMFELGRPTHIFDLEKIHGSLDVRWGKEGEKLELLNGATVTIDESVGVIADEQQVESLAGIMGGNASAVSDETQHIYVEAAFWWPKAIAGRSRRFNFSTDAGHRFERGVDPSHTVEHLERITQLILEICGTPDTLCGPIDDQQVNLPAPRPVTMRVPRACKIIGMTLSEEQCALALTRLGFPLTIVNSVITVIPPSFRFDIQIEEDLIEEVARMVGYDNLPHTPPIAPISAKIRAEGQRSPFAVRHEMADLGYQETINFSFVDERWERELSGNANPISLLNPITSQMSVMRSSMLGSLIQVLKFNQDRKAQRVRIFEIGRVFLRDPNIKNTDTTVEGFDQPMRLAALVCGNKETLQWGVKDQNVDFFDVKGDIESLMHPLKPTFLPAVHAAMHPGRTASISLFGQLIGYVGELHPKWRQSYDLNSAPIMFELELDAVLLRTIPKFKNVAKHQAVERDIAVIVDEKVSHSDLMKSIWAASNTSLLREATLFDVYIPKSAKEAMDSEAQGHVKSLAVRLKINSDDATLTEEEIETVVKSILDSLVRDLGARQRA